jgi:translation initiation factor IF-2
LIPEARRVADERGVEIKTYQIIYELIEDVQKAVAGMLKPILREETLGQAEVLQVFMVSKVGKVAGCIVRDGEIRRDGKARVYRDDRQIYAGEIESLKRHKDDASSVKKGLECGLSIKGFDDIKVGDFVEAYKIVEEKAILPSSRSSASTSSS